MCLIQIKQEVHNIQVIHVNPVMEYFSFVVKLQILILAFGHDQLLLIAIKFLQNNTFPVIPEANAAFSV